MTDESATTAAEQPQASLAEQPQKDAAPPKRRRKRWPWVLGGLGVLIGLFLFFIGSVTLLDYTESTPFCSLCHVMYPERTAYDNSPHSRVECGTCHIGPGVIPAIQGKLAAVRYLWVYPLNLYERPIPSPIKSLRPTTIVCEQCHWPQKFYAERLKIIPTYAQDEQNSLTQTELLLKTGGGAQNAGLGRGIHWHIEHPVYYIATDEKRQNIPWVQAEYSGTVTEYISTDSTLTAEDIAKAEKRKMDCVDCHNRATHIFRNPDTALDEALANGSIPADLPFIKQFGAEVLTKPYASEAEAAAAIAGVADLYKSQHADVYSARQADVERAVAGLQEIFDKNVFPFMNVTWESHPSNIGHQDSPGCFRCHDGKHLTSNNQAIRLECNICHSIPQVADPGKPLPAISLPSAAEPETHRSTTWLAEHRYKFDASCESCHTVDNPGGNDNSSFCSNSACHATEWKYVGLNAAKVRELSAPPAVPSKGGPNPVPHPISATTDCKICHGPGKVKPYPDNHSAFTPDMCVSCHQATLKEGMAAPGAAPAIPHLLEGMGECKTCHAAGGIKPWPANHAAFTPDLCTSCHKTGQPGVAPGAAPAIPHVTEGGMAECTNCHGPDGIKPFPANHANFKPTICGNCHTSAQTSAAPTATPSEGSDDKSAGPGAIPHDLAGREDCLMCHNPNGGIKPAPADHVGRTSDQCQSCHKPAL